MSTISTNGEIISLEALVGFPHTWADPQMAAAGQEIIDVICEADLPPKQLDLQKRQLQCLVYVDTLTSAIEGLELRPLDESRYDYLRKCTFAERTMPPVAVDILAVLDSIPTSLPITEWAILEDPPQRRTKDPHLAFKLGDMWYSVYRWT
jgi:hypothetical protein